MCSELFNIFNKPCGLELIILRTESSISDGCKWHFTLLIRSQVEFLPGDSYLEKSALRGINNISVLVLHTLIYFH